jgi:sugar lactone lactonase YvrE
MSENLGLTFKLKEEDIAYIGHDLSRPECVVYTRDGVIWTSDNRASAMRIDPSGGQTLFGPKLGTANGLAFDQLGYLYVADIDAECVYRVAHDGSHEIVCNKLNGAVNFVYFDQNGKLWITVSTKTKPRSNAVSTPIADGYVLTFEKSELKVVSENICFTNEVRIDHSAQKLLISETALGRVLCQDIHTDGSLGVINVFGPESLFRGAIVDGICFDSIGNLWVTEITRNSIYVISQSGQVNCIFEDPSGLVMNCPTSIAFGGSDMRTVYIGSLKMNKLVSFRAPYPGQKMHHFDDTNVK